MPRDTCVDPFTSPLAYRDVSSGGAYARRQTTVDLTQGHTTTDDFGTDGDDTAHTAVETFTYPHFFQGLGGFPADGSAPDVVDLIFTEYIESDILGYFSFVGGDAAAYTSANISYYVDQNFSTQTYLPLFVQSSEMFQQNLDDCTIY